MSGNGWRAGYLCAAIIVLTAGVLVLLFIRSRPSDMDLMPYGFGYVCKKTKAKIIQDHWHGYTMQQLVRRPAFYLMLVVTFLSATCIYLMFSVIVPHVQDHGLSASDASTLQGAMLTLLAVSKVLVGILSDKIGVKPVTILCLLTAAASLWMMADVSGMADAWIILIIYSFALTLAAVIPPLLTNALFGYQAYSKCVGIITAMVSLGGLVAAPISNMCFDRLGSYSPVFRVGAIISLVVTGLYLLLFLLARKDRLRYEKELAQNADA
jgi:predicted MFS family arabinose efflux permease